MKNNLYNPKVSIIIPVYNGANYLEEAIDSALKQTYENIEVIVVNDGSTDKGLTEDIAKSYGDKIKYIYKKNGGVSSALNCGIKEMSGEYFSWLSHDDGYNINKVKDAITLLKDVNEINKKTIAYTHGVYINSKGEKIRPMKQKLESHFVYSGIQAAYIMAEKGTLNGCCMLIPKNAFINVGLFNEKLRYSQDSLMWYQLFLNGYGIVSDSNVNVVSRIHKEQVTLTRKDLYHQDAKYIAEILAKHLIEADENGVLLYKYMKRISKHNSDSAVQYLYDYAKENNVLSKSKYFSILIFRVWGKCRYQLSKMYKKIVTRG